MTGKRKISVRLTAGALLVLTALLLGAGFLAYRSLGGYFRAGSLFPGRESRSVFSTLERVDDLALLECAVYRIRAVYPFDFPLSEEEMAPYRERYEFCVVSARITAGYDLSALVTFPPGDVPLEQKGGRIILDLGEPQITSFVIEDQVVMEEGFPDMKITPDEWRSIAESVTPLIEQMALDRGIMEEAEIYGREFFTRLFEGAGYECSFGSGVIEN